MDKNTFIRHYCANYRILENRLIESSDYVSIDRTNYATFSSNFIFLFLSICSEIDSLAGEYCKSISDESDFKCGGIVDKIEMIITKYPNLRNTRIDTKEPFERQSFVPFTKIEKDNSSWWTDYNKIKHNRTEKDCNERYNYQKANLKNILHSIAALYILLLLIGKEYGYTVPSALFEDYVI